MKFSTYIGIILLIVLAFSLPGKTQSVFKGEVIDINEQLLPLANAQWYGTQTGASADENGAFVIPFPPDSLTPPFRMIISFADLKDTFEIDDLYSYWRFQMDATVTLQEVTIYNEKKGAYISQLLPVKTEIINRNELRKAACCDLAGCFETQSTVQPQTTNILTNAKELRILGLSGVYNQVLVDGLPTIQGLTYTYGISTIPGSLLENIWVVKGANSVLQGYENMVGQITVFPREGGTAEPFTADLLVNSFGEQHLNAAVAIKKEKWTNYLAVHTSRPGRKLDRDGDDFLDLPLISRYSLYNKWRFRKENETGFSSFIGIRLVDEQRIGGQINFDPETDKGSTSAYGQVTRFLQTEIYTKSGFRFDDHQKISLLASKVRHDQTSWFGVVRYEADQDHYYANLQYELFYGKKKQHDLKSGISYRYLHTNEDISFTSDTVQRTYNGHYIKHEIVPGVFVENIFKSNDARLTAITGIRADKHATFGWFLTPRLLLKYQLSANTDIRGSIGSGWRTVNLFSENINLLTSNRNLLFKEALQPEKSINAGVNATHKWQISQIDFVATADFYHTRFQNQFFPDYDSIPGMAVIGNFTQPSVSNGFQAEISADINKKINLRLAYNFLDVYRRMGDIKMVLPYNARHRFLAVASVHSENPHWQVDMNLHWYGQQKLPDSQWLPNEFQQPDFSSEFTIISLQYTHSFPEIEIFGGCENLIDFRQLLPITGYQNPFGSYFDTSFAWGPTRGREFYIGFRYKLRAEK